MFNISFQVQLFQFSTNFDAFLPYFWPKTPKTPTKTLNRQKPSDVPPRYIICKKTHKNPSTHKNPVIPFSHFSSILYIPHPIKKYKNKYPLAKILKKWTTWTTRLIIREICATKCATMRYISQKWTTFTRQKLHIAKTNH